MAGFNRLRLSFDELFEKNKEEALILKKEIVIGTKEYSIGDEFKWEEVPDKFPETVEELENCIFTYIPHKDGDIIMTWLRI